jgi:hypothetical protein
MDSHCNPARHDGNIRIATAKPNRHTPSMIKKRAPEQYAAKPKNVVVKTSITTSMHPALGVAKTLVSWMARGGVPPSIILLHGLHFARSPENDGLPVDTYRPQLTMQGTDNKAISAILDALARPQADKTQVIAAWLQSVWVKKSAGASRITPSTKEHKKPTAPKKQVRPPRKAKVSTLTKPKIEVKTKR